MTTVLTEMGSHSDSGETFADRNAYLEAIILQNLARTAMMGVEE